MTAQLIDVCTDPDKGFKGNRAAIVMLDGEVSAQQMQEWAHSLQEPATSFLFPSPKEGTLKVRWFAPDEEIGLCGHGSLAAFALLAYQETNVDTLDYRGGSIQGMADKQYVHIALDEIRVKWALDVPPLLRKGLGVDILEYFETDNKNIVVLENEGTLRNMAPDFATLRKLETFGYTVTAPGDEADFVSRTLVPHVQQLEDQATGSSHAALTPFWAKRLNKPALTAYQLSPNGGTFFCTYEAPLVKLKARYKMAGEVRL